MRRWSLILAPAVLGAVPAAAQDAGDPLLEQLQARLRFTLEEIEVTPAENMGLFGLHLDVYPLPSELPGLYVGLGGFGSVTGQRGGFLIGGLSAGWDQELLDGLHLEAGGFFGGGGGGAAPQGSGLMLRGFGAARVDLGRLGLRVELSAVDFPDGGISSTQLAAGLTWETRPWIGRRLGSAPAGVAAPGEATAPLRIGLSLQAYDTAGSARRTANRPLDETIVLPGIRADRFLTDEIFATLAAHGAVRGHVDGYAQLLAGLGLRLPVADGLALEPMMQVGAGGGGAVDTGGGLLLQPELALRIAAGRRTSLYLGGGWTWSPNGHFAATTAEAGLAWESRPLRFPASAAGLAAPATTSWKDWRVQVAHKSWFTDGGARLKSGAAMDDVQLVGFAVAHPLAPWADLTGQAFGAWDGGIGGYAEGMLGADLHLPAGEIQPFLRLLAGGGGGGGVDLGSGLIYEGDAGARLPLGRGLGLEVAAGRVEATSGSFGATVFRVALGIDFALPVSHQP